MKPDPHPEAIERILAGNPEVKGVRIDAEKHDLEVGFADSVPAEPARAKIDASLHRELPDPEAVMHSPEVVHPPGTSAAGVHFHHHHLGAGVIEFHRGDAEPRGRASSSSSSALRFSTRSASPSASSATKAAPSSSCATACASSAPVAKPVFEVNKRRCASSKECAARPVEIADL